jgi:Protein of unknown function (DUF2865)
LSDGNWEQSGTAIVLLPISSVGPRTMFRFFGGITLAAVAVTLAWAAQSQSRPPSAVAGRADPVPHTTAGQMPVNANWFDLLFESARRHKEPESERPRRRDDRPEGGTYRTLCVRLCDGFYFPISYSTQRGRFAGDAKQCEQSCPARSRLFVHRNPGQDVDDMVDLDGHLYRSLPAAFLHRAQYTAGCTCRGNPWDEASVARHRAYAEAPKQTVIGKPVARLPSTRTKRGPRGEESWARRE